MVDVISSQKCHSSPNLYWNIKYEYKRTGADMYYRFYWKVYMSHPDSLYDYGIALKLFLDGVAYSITVKAKDVGVYNWTKEGTTGWYKVTGKTSGTTSFYAQLYDTSRSFVMTTSSTYNLAVSGAPSVLGAIANFVIGDDIPISITKYDDAYWDDLVITYGGTTVKTIYGVSGDIEAYFTDGELNVIYGLMEKVKSGTFTFTLTTTAESGVLGTSVKTATGSITNANPTYTASKVTYADTNTTVVGITGNNQHIVQNKSTLTVTLSGATGNKGAKISKYDVTVNGVTKTATTSGSVSFGTVNTSQDTKITVVVTDSRGNTTTVEKTVTILAYATPVMNVTLERLNNYEDETYLTVGVTLASINGKNTTSISYKKAQSGGSFGAATTLTNEVKHTTSCDKNYAYTFSITVTDKFETVTKEFILPKGRFPLFIDTVRNAVGINEFPSDGEALRVAGGIARFDDGIVLKSASGTQYLLKVTDNGTLSIEAY